jgi:hypothetical protein
MPNHATNSLKGPYDSQQEHSFAPDFAWALVGGAVVLVLSVLLYTLVVTWGGVRLDAAMPGGEAAPLSAHSRELAGLFLGGALVVLVARGIGLQTR